MEANWIKQKLDNYQPQSPKEAADLEKLLELVTNEINCFNRDHFTPGHITGSAWIVSHKRDYALLTHHLKLQKWVQLGGHSDGHPNTFDVALREGQEESGLTSIKPLSDEIFDIDVHTIPTHGKEPEHLHFDLRFLFEADANEPFLRQEEESLDLRWIPLNQIDQYTKEEAVLKMARKTKKLFPNE